MFKILSRIFLLATIVGISACAGIQHKTDDERVLALAEKRQAALLKQDFAGAYKFMSPGYREVNSLRKFTSNYLGVHSWDSSRVYKTVCEEDICTVYVEVQFDASMLMGAAGHRTTDGKMLLPRVSKETWVKLDNKWWFSKSD